MYGNVRPRTAVYGNARLCTAMHGYFGLTYSYARLFPAFYGYARLRTNVLARKPDFLDKKKKHPLKIDIFPKGSMVFVKILKFLHLFFLGQIG